MTPKHLSRITRSPDREPALSQPARKVITGRLIGSAIRLAMLVFSASLMITAQTRQAPESRVGGATMVTGTSN